jgi:hypothetical protein
MSEQAKEQRVGEINFVPARNTILLDLQSERFGLDLSMMKEHPLDLLVVATGKDCVNTKVGDRVVVNGQCLTINVDGRKYLQTFESQIMGYVLNGAKVSTEVAAPTNNLI